MKNIKKMKKRILAGASSGILASMLILGAGNAYADISPNGLSPNGISPSGLSPLDTQVENANNGMHIMHRFNSVTKINSLALQLGLSSEDVKTELASGKSVKQILLDHGITGTEIEKAFSDKKNMKGWRKNS